MVLRLPPYAPNLANSLRGLGYSTATAVADLIDNSLTAGATRVEISFEWSDEAPSVQILDNGRGMDRDRLIGAMRLGADPRTVRGDGDLGRFGLGLKTASLSQAAVLTVLSKAEGTSVFCARWDLAQIEEAAEWDLIEGTAAELDVSAAPLESLPSGTLVRWDNLDRLLASKSDIDTLFAVAETVGRHLGMTFHRLIDEQGFQIILNGVAVLSWDPVAKDLSTALEEMSIGEANPTLCRSFLIAPPSILSEEQERRAAGPLDWIQQQGFYVYRERRMIVSGGWLGLGPASGPWRFDPRYNLARLTLDISNASDVDWAIDVRKSAAEPPAAIIPFLLKLAQRARRKAVSRAKGPSALAPGTNPPDALSPIWVEPNIATTAPYRVNRRHPLVIKIRKALPDAGMLRTLLDHIERTAPLPPIRAAAGENLAAAAASALRQADVRKLLLTVYPTYRRALKLTKDEASAKLMEQPHFREHEGLVLETVDVIERDMQGAL